jgi:pimeloyl-ACP methyl ester carboxylesterase
MGQLADVRPGTVEANGIRFGFLEAGDGPLVLLLHGFPDNAHTWSRQLPLLASSGYRAVAPFLRGYPPTATPPDGRYDAEALGTDVAELIRALGSHSAYLVGNDWGAVSAYAAMALYPELIRRSVVISAGHTATLAPTINHPRQVHHIFHFWFFQIPQLAVSAVRANDFAFVDYLWDYWTVSGHDDHEHIADVKQTLAPAGATEAALGYYPALLNLPIERPDIATKMRATTTVPTLAVFGAEDPPRELSVGEHVNFSAEYRLETIDRAGHFVHRERPDTFNRLLLDWLSADPLQHNADRLQHNADAAPSPSRGRGALAGPSSEVSGIA